MENQIALPVQRIGLVGCGNWGSIVLRDLLQLKARVTVVARSDASKARATALGCADIVPSIEALNGAHDGYVVVTPTNLHAAAIEALIPFGKPIFTEKAMTSSVDSANRIAARAGDRVFVMDKWRYHPGIEKMRQLVEAGEIGKPIALHSQRVGWSTVHDELDPVWLLLPHDLAIALHILGDVPVPVSANGRVVSSLAAELQATLKSASGASVHIEVSSMRPVNRRSVTLVGEACTVQLEDSYSAHLKLRRGAPGNRTNPEEELPLSDEMPLLSELQRFLDHLRGGPRPMSSAQEGLRIVETIVALRNLAGLVP